MRSLYEFIQDKLNIDLGTSTIYQENFKCGQFNGLDEILITCFILQNSRKVALPCLPGDLSHKAVIDHCIIYLLTGGFYNNVLTFGYKIARNEDVDNSLFCHSANVNVTLLKGVAWEMFHSLIGTTAFVDLLINYTVIQFNGQFFTQIVGNRCNEPHLPPKWAQRTSSSSDTTAQIKQLMGPVTNKPFLHRLKINSPSFFPYGKILPLSSSFKKLADVRETIFPINLVKIPQRLKVRINLTLQKLLNRHKRLNYVSILNSICSPLEENVSNLSHLSRQSPKEQVLRFIIVILQKLLPQEMFGSKKNKCKIIKNLNLLLNLPLNGYLPFDSLLKKLRLKDFRWLLVSDVSFTKQNFENLNQLVTCFISWLFRHLFPKIIQTFFYCTEISSTVTIVYFRHDIWNKLVTPFLAGYFKKYLVENNVCRNHNSYTLSNFNHSKMRIIPKKSNNEFRIIAIPCGGADDEEFVIYKENHKNAVAPTQKVLEYLRNKRQTSFTKIYSPMQIADRIKEFKQSLLKKFNNVLPELYFMKFDVKSCYDSIPRMECMRILKEALKSENGFFVRSQSFFNTNTGVLKLVNVVNASRVPKSYELYIDNVRTIHLSNQDVINVVEMEIFKTALWVEDKCYLREDGLFQGSSLSAPIVDLMYDDLLEFYGEFKTRPNQDTLILRLADDFLIISTDQQQIINIKNLALGGFQKYNAKANEDKILAVSSHSDDDTVIQFCAMHIFVKKLEVWKHSSTMNNFNIRSSSSKRIFRSLIALFNTRISYKTIDSNLNSITTVLMQIHHVVKNISEGYKSAFKDLSINDTESMQFSSFLLRIIEMTVDACPITKCDSLIEYEVRFAILNGFLESLSSNASKFKKNITLLKKEIQHLQPHIYI
uniref:Telomerase reverse transcriptase n=1 Tax=Saccharomyces paradoxus TaxID=27291 RepID=Q0P797_SACPA|nr:EST2 protein [Saccharomyces paradoxus]CAL36036.1 EST2 protein [Saccharomyces paradoxus]CAL36037.1 EST2 protein [Saccharomyces paradoxus]CAL36038.1 EST2 protein [Saccharomyces paradoxus]